MSSIKCNLSDSMKQLVDSARTVRLEQQSKDERNQVEMKRNCPPVRAPIVMKQPRRVLALILTALLLQSFIPLMMRGGQVTGNPVLMRVCDTREVKTVTNRVCMLYKRTKNSDVKLDKQGNLRITRSSAGLKGEYSPAKLAHDCCKIGCPPHIFANIC